jgi:hypothetical protein
MTDVNQELEKLQETVDSDLEWLTDCVTDHRDDRITSNAAREYIKNLRKLNRFENMIRGYPQ